MKFKKSRLVSLSNLEFNFFIFFCGATLRKHYIIKATLSVIKKFAFSVRTVLKFFFWL